MRDCTSIYIVFRIINNTKTPLAKGNCLLASINKLFEKNNSNNKVSAYVTSILLELPQKSFLYPKHCILQVWMGGARQGGVVNVHLRHSYTPALKSLGSSIILRSI